MESVLKPRAPAAEIVLSRSPIRPSTAVAEADPIRTEVLRRGLNSAANQMRLTLSRASVTSLLSETGDGAVGLVDRQFRLLGSSPMLPIYTGVLGYCVEATVAALGGEEALEPGDVLLHTSPFETGSHPQDIAVMLPVFVADELIGYGAVMAHVADLGAKGAYCVDTTDVFQEGLIVPGVKLCRGGKFVDDVYRIFLSNSRFPKLVAADMNAIIAALRAGESALIRLVARHRDVFHESVEHIYDHGEAVVRSYIGQVPDGRYTASVVMDNNGLDEEPVEFEVTVEINGSTVRVDWSNGPDASRGAINSPLPQTISLTRVAITDLAGAGEAPNEGFYRPIEVITRPGSMFHPIFPSPTFLATFTAANMIEVLYRALAKALPEGLPAGSGGDALDLCLWGASVETGEGWSEYLFGTSGHGASARGDGVNTCQMNGESSCCSPSVELDEHRNKLFYVKNELAPDSGGAGKYRGGLGHDQVVRVLGDFLMTGVLSRNAMAPWGLAGGWEGRSTSRYIEYPDGTREFLGNRANQFAPEGSAIENYLAGGGGYGLPSERDPAAIRNDLRDGYITLEHARRHYSHALTSTGSEG